MQSFKTKEDLYERITPALNVKLNELKRLNYFNIKKEDIWNYLSYEKWSKAHGLTLSDIVRDIIHLDNNKLYNYTLKK